MPHPSIRRATLGAALLLATAALGAGSAQAATLPTLTLTLTPTTVTVGDAPSSGGVNVVAKAVGTKEASANLILLKPGVTVAQVYAFLAADEAGKDPNTVSRFGALVYDAEAPAGTSEAQTRLQPGQYVALNPEGPKSSRWGHASFIVAPATSPVALPAPQAVETTIDFDFRGPSTLHNGELVGFENEGYVVHMNLAFPAKSHKAAKLLLRALRAGNERRAQKLVAGPPVTFAGPLSTGGYQQTTISAKPGWYVQACFMPTQDGTVHTKLGMERIIRITK